MHEEPDTIEECIEKFRKDLTKRTTEYTPRTVRHYVDHSRIVFRLLHTEYPGLLPSQVKAKHVQWLVSEMISRKYAVSTEKHYVQALRKICPFYGNNAVGKMKIRWPHDSRPNADWLTLEQAMILLSAPKSPTQELLVHLELCLGFRRVECARLTIQSITDRYLDISGKGSMGGKPRRVPFHRDTQRVINRYLKYREELIERAQSRRRRPINVPDELMITQNIQPFETDRCTGLDYHMNKLVEMFDFDFGNHTLRRTFGRLMYKANKPNVPISVISMYLGHSSESETIKYLGLDFDDMQSAIVLFPL